MRSFAPKLVVLSLLFSLMIPTPTYTQQEGYIPRSTPQGRYEYINYSQLGSNAQATVHYPNLYTDVADSAYINVWTPDVKIEAQWTPYGGLQLLYVYFYDGEFVYPDYAVQPDTVGSLGLAPLPGDPPCDGEDCKQCIDRQLAFCQDQNKAKAVEIISNYWGRVAVCLGGLIVPPPAGEWIVLICMTAASTAAGAAVYKARQEKRQCEYDRPRSYCHHAENGQPCLP